MRRLFKRFFLAVGITAFLFVVWANRTGRLKVPNFDWGGTITPVTDATAWKPGIIPVKIGIFAENIYDFNLSTQSVATEGLVWISWGSAFQELLDTERASHPPGQSSQFVGLLRQAFLSEANTYRGWRVLSTYSFCGPLLCRRCRPASLPV